MKNIYIKLYVAALLAIGSQVYAKDSKTPYTITVVNNTDSDGITTTLGSRNTQTDKNKSKMNRITQNHGAHQDVSLTQDLRSITVSGWKRSSNPNNIQQIVVRDNSNGTQKYRRGAQIFIYGGVIPGSSDTTNYPISIVVCGAGAVSSNNYQLSPIDAAKLGIQYKKEIN